MRKTSGKYGPSLRIGQATGMRVFKSGFTELLVPEYFISDRNKTKMSIKIIFMQEKEENWTQK